MKVIADLCVVPIGVGVHLATYIAACERVLSEAGLKIQLHPSGNALPQGGARHGLPAPAHHEEDNTRTDREQTREDKVASVQALL